MAHPSISESMMCSLSPFSNPLPPINSGPSLPRLNQNSAVKSHVKWSTPLTHIKFIPAREAISAAAEVDVPQYSFQQNEVGTIAGAMEGLDLTHTASHTSTKPPTNALPAFHPSLPPSPQPVSIIQAAILQNHPHTVATLNPNLRFILAAHNKAKGPQKSSDITDKRSIGTVTGEFTFSMHSLQVAFHSNFYEQNLRRLRLYLGQQMKLYQQLP